MRRAVLALLLSGASFSASAQMDGATWLSMYDKDDSSISKALALGYIAGYWDAYTLSMLVDTYALKNMSCVDPTVDAKQLADVLKGYLIAHPSIRKERTAVTLRVVMTTTWPCKK